MACVPSGLPHFLCYCPPVTAYGLKIPVGFLFFGSQAGEGMLEEGCGADETSGPQLQTWFGGFTSKCRMVTLHYIKRCFC